MSVAHVYLNSNVIETSAIGNSSTPINKAVLDIKRSSPPVSNSRSWLLSMDRYALQARVPLFDPAMGVFSITFKNISTSAETTQVVNFSAVSSSDGYIHQYYDFLTALNTALSALCTTLSIADVPTMSLDTSLKRFTVNTVSAFRSAYKLGFNYPLYRLFNSFPAERGSVNYLYLASDSVTQWTSTLEYISPVRKIQLVASGLPIKKELTPAPVGTDQVSARSEPILTDYAYFHDQLTDQITVVYNADGNHRYCNMDGRIDDGSSFSVEFQWVDYNNVSHEIWLYEDDYADIKMKFRAE